jgi:hypothetical protein
MEESNSSGNNDKLLEKDFLGYFKVLIYWTQKIIYIYH